MLTRKRVCCGAGPVQTSRTPCLVGGAAQGARCAAAPCNQVPVLHSGEQKAESKTLSKKGVTAQ
jgi:hypothetical protein